MGSLNLKVDFRELKAFKKKYEALAAEETGQFLKETVDEIATLLYNTAKERTPVGKYTEWDPREGGTLKRSWTKSKVMDKGSYYEVIVENLTPYASFVEKGHRQTPGRYVSQIRKRLKKGFVQGKFFLEKSEMETKDKAKGIIEKRLRALFEGIEDGK